MKPVSTYLSALNGREDLLKYGDNALLLFALQIRFELEDIDTVATNSLTDGIDDKKCDLLYIDTDRELAVIAQGYMRRKEPFPSHAPSNKASDLNTAIAWLLATPVDDLPEGLRSAAFELRTALEKGEIGTIEFWYSHNLPESENAKQELNTVAINALNTIRQNFPASSDINIRGMEVGDESIEALYRSLTTPILVSDDIEVSVSQGFEMQTDSWKTFVTAIPGVWLHQIFRNYKLQLFSANIRGYLGSRNVDANINNSIKLTAQDEPSNFCIFNNGITVITNQVDYDENAKLLRLKGISIVNGAQTTGAIGNLDSLPSEEVMIQARFIVCSNPETIKSVIRYNNSQNTIEAPDFRSNDAIQTRLVEEFELIPDSEYLGGRRGGAEDIIRRRSNLLPSSTVGQALTAFHGDPLNSYNRKSDIWKSNGLYGKIFNGETTARHIVLVYSLYEALDDFKREISAKKKTGNMTGVELEQFGFFEKRGSTVIATTAVASCLEVVLNQQIANYFRLSFGDISPGKAKQIWVKVLEPLLALVAQLSPAVNGGIKERETEDAIKVFRLLVNATKSANNSIYSEFEDKIRIS